MVFIGGSGLVIKNSNNLHAVMLVCAFLNSWCGKIDFNSELALTSQ